MLYRPLGQSGIQSSVIAFGAWAIGGWWWGGTRENDPMGAIHAAIDAGINLIDTAPMYGFGRSEELVGQAIKDRRDKVVLATKCGLRWDLAKGTPFFEAEDPEDAEKRGKVYRYLGPESIRQEVERSLRRLGTDYIDLYQTHWQDPTTPVAETIGVLMELKEEGKIRAIGVSNATTAEMEQYRVAGQLDTDQERYSLIDRKLDEEILPYCERNNIAVLAYSPLRHGLLTGKVGPERTFAEGDARAGLSAFSADNRAKVGAMLDEMRPLAEEHDLTIAQLVLAWTVAQPGLTHALAGARNAEQALANAKAGSTLLDPDTLQTIAAIHARHAGGIE